MCLISQGMFSSFRPSIEEDMLSLFAPAITEEDNLFLCSIPSEVGVVQAFSNLGSTKAPRPDGFTTLFFKKYWSFVIQDVLKCTSNFFQNQQLLFEQNHTHIALAPKQNGSHSVHHFRQISLCNITYNIITKILASRLKTFPRSYPLFNQLLSPPEISKTIPS